MHILSAWGQLAPKILSANSNKKELLAACVEWYARHKGVLDEAHYQLGGLVSLDFEAYADANDMCSPDEAASVRALTLSLPKKHPSEAAARRLRDAFEAILAVKKSTACLNCGSSPLYAETYFGGVFWVCFVCGVSQAHGRILKLNSPVETRLATPDEVRAGG